MYSRTKQKIRTMLREGYQVEQIKESFPILKVSSYDIKTIKENLRTNQYYTASDGTKIWHCRSCDSWKPRNKEYFQSSKSKYGDGLSSTCKVCRNQVKKNKRIFAKNTKTFTKTNLNDKRRWIRIKTMRIIDKNYYKIGKQKQH